MIENKQDLDLCLEQLLVQKGNKKIPSSTAIFNMGSATHCPSLNKGLCYVASIGVKCYAMKAERLYPRALPFRLRQAKFWKKISAKEFVRQFLEIQKSKRKPFTALRFNEAGDFTNQDCVNKAEEIAFWLHHEGITCYCYTSRSDLDYSKIRHLVISGSGFTKPGISNLFSTLHSLDELKDGVFLCPQDCNICSRCQDRGQTISVLKH